ncbi:MAG: polyphosphate polymerase domain-containing protein [Limisphaerales bacterium]
MTPTLPNLRYEWKFIADGLTLTEVLAMVRRHPSAFHETYPARVVNNIYLDSPSHHDYQDHISGAANRTKTRVRWYGPPTGPIERPVLERKFKRGEVSGKEFHALPALSLNGGSVQPLLKTAFNRAVFPEMLRSVLRCLHPSLFNRYRRYYFLSRDGRFRLTVDSELQFANAGAPSGSGAFLPLHTPVVIIELKFAPELAEQAGPVTHALRFRLTRCSKYVLGIQRVEGL